MKAFLTAFSIFAFFKLDCAQANSCAFCNSEIIESQAAFKSKYFTVAVDYAPRVPGHLLVIPKRHIMKAHELSSEEWEELSLIIPKVVQIFSEYLHTDEYIILEKNGPGAFQTVPHVHFHLFPVRNQKWPEIFDIVPDRLSAEELENEINRFRSYFLMVNSMDNKEH